jgi:hypothetical protein
MSAPELKNKNLHLVKLANSANKIVSHGDLKQDIITLCQSISNLQELKETKLSTIVKYVCELIENGKYKPKDEKLKLNKRDLAIDALTCLFPDLNNDLDKKRLSDLIDFVCESNLVKKVGSSQIIKKGVVNFIKKKLL